MKLIIFLSLFLLSFSSHAKKLTFTFNISSSGPDIYPCNVGLRHLETTGGIDYFQTSYGNWDGWSYVEESSNTNFFRKG